MSAILPDKNAGPTFLSFRADKDNLSFFVCIISVIIVTIIFYLPEGYLGGYKIGYELLPINGLITFFGLYIIRKSTT